MTRLSNGHFAKGVSGNPGGRPPIPEDIKAMLKNLVPDAVRALHAAVNGDDPRLSVVAAQTILDRVYGKAHVSASIEAPEQTGPQAHLAALVAMASATQARIEAAAISTHDDDR